MIALVVVLFIIIIVLSNDVSSLKKENRQLKKNIEKLKRQLLKDDEPYEIYNGSSQQTSNNELAFENVQQENNDNEVIYNNSSEQSIDNEPIYESNYNDNESLLPDKDEYETLHSKSKSKKDNKNKVILIAGAVSIVLAAIVFLLSTWSTTPNFLKILIMVLITFLFFGLSRVAEKRFHLEQTSKTFYYIALTYIPVVLFALPALGLLGDYFSLNGEGRNIYFTISSVFLAVLYYIESIRKNSKPLAISSIVLQILSVIFGVLIFNDDVYNILFGILIYHMVLIIIVKAGAITHYTDLYNKFVNTTFIALVVVTFLAMAEKWVLATATVINILYFIILIISYYILKLDKQVYREFFNINLLMIILTIISLDGFDISLNMKILIMSLAVVILYAYNYLRYKNITYKTIAYIAFNFTLLAITQLLDMDNLTKYILPVTTIIYMLIERVEAEDDRMKNYLIVSFILSFITLNVNITITSFITLIALSIVFMIYTRIHDKEEAKMLDLAPMIAIIPGIFVSDLFNIEIVGIQLNILFAYLLILVASSISLTKNEATLSTIMSVVYFIITAIKFEMSVYAGAIIAMIWAILHAIRFEQKNPFKVIAYLAGLVLYEKLLYDYAQNVDITLVHVLGYLICTHLITRTVIKKAGGDYKAIEYIAYSIIFIYALFAYTGIEDAMIFITFLIFTTILGYALKYGPLFLTSAIAIIVNLIKLTKDFWTSIPWWVYLLVVGAVLLTFAIKNEINERDKKKTLKTVIQYMRDKIDI